MLLTIEPGGSVYDRVADAITERIALGELVQGDRLPSARDLAEALGLNVHTVLHAYQRLRDDGIVELRRGRGAVVVGAAAVAELRAAVAELVAAARQHGAGEALLVGMIRKEFCV